jgi:uracil-DNA glycosylase family 4
MTDPTRFDLDERQRAMLAEMGIRVWWPQGPQDAPPPATPLQAAQPEAPLQTPVQTPPPARPAMAAPPRPATPAAPAASARPAVMAPTATELPADAVPLPASVDQMDWDTLQATVAQCRACGLCQGRRNTVFGVGDRQAQWMVIGEAPGENEDLQGEPFVGQAGKLLDNMLAAIGLNRGAAGAQAGQAGVYIANTLKCRPPGNRNPEPIELQTCAPYLVRQVALVQPRIILAMGRFAVQSLLQTTEPIGRLRGRVHQYQGVPVVVTYHPAYLLRNPADKAKAWADLCLALQTAQG